MSRRQLPPEPRVFPFNPQRRFRNDHQSRRQDPFRHPHADEGRRAQAGYRPTNCSRARKWRCSRCRAPSRRPARPSICRALSSNAGALKAKGVDAIACLSVNDAFVMGAWGKHQGAGDKVMMLADGNGDFTRALGLEMDASKFGMGKRSQRYSMIVDNGVVKSLNVEQPGAFEVSERRSHDGAALGAFRSCRLRMAERARKSARSFSGCPGMAGHPDASAWCGGPFPRPAAATDPRS